jgi:hypothetical protein
VIKPWRRRRRVREARKELERLRENPPGVVPPEVHIALEAEPVIEI